MGQEYGESNPFPFFCDFQDPSLIEAVREGRKKEFSYFGWKDEPTDPFDPSTRDSAVLSWTWSEPPRDRLRDLYRDLLRFRRTCPALREFQLPEVRLLGDQEAPRVLEMVRRPKSGSPLTIYMNLGPDPFDLPAELAREAPTFRSETPAQAESHLQEKTNPMTLAPWEFVLFGPLS